MATGTAQALSASDGLGQPMVEPTAPDGSPPAPLSSVRASAGPSASLPFGHVARARLIDYIDRPYLSAVTLIVAEAGAGKTTLAVEWASSAENVGWVIFDGTFDDEADFAAALLGAIHRALGIDQAARPRIVRAGGARDALLADVRSLDADVCVIIDNWEAAPNAACASLIDDLLAVPDSRLRLMMIGRREPPLRLGRLRASGRVRELGSDELRLTRPEAEAILRALVPVELTVRQIDRIVASAEGWVAGVVLLGLELRRGLASGTPPGDWPSPDTIIDDYVEQELLATLPAELQAFVLATAGLPWLAPDICAATLGVDVTETLETVDREFFFLRRDGTDLARYRYHGLVRESLRRLARTAVPERVIHERVQRAGAWLIADGELEAAARLALELPASLAMIELMTPLCRHLADRSDFEALEWWLDQVPDSVIAGNLDLGWWRFVAGVGTGSGRVFGAGALLDDLEPRALASGSPLHIARMHLGRGALAFFAGRDEEASGRLIDALSRLPADAVVERMYATWMLGDIAFRDGRDDNAVAAFKEAEACAGQLPLDERWSWLVIAPGRANGYAIRGDVHSAITKYRLILAELPSYLTGVSLEGFLRCRLISLLIERNDLDAARQEYEAVEGLLGGEPRAWQREAILAQARLLLAEGRRDEAEQWAANHLRQLRRLPGKTQLVHLLARIWLERGEYPMVESWLADIDAMESPWVRVFGEINYRVLAIGLDLGRERYEEAAAAAEALAGEATRRRRWSEEILLLTRLAVALHHLGNGERARDTMRRALERGARGGFVRSYYVPGFDTLAMFSDVWTEQPEYQPARRALRDILGREEAAEGVLLSKRELEVLRLVAEGRTNQQVAAAMFISTNTVRNHLVRIGQRLEAHNRQEAVARARELGLLQ